MGLIIVAFGVVDIAAPSVLLEFGRSLLTPTALYVVAVVRVIFGALLLWIASASRMPRTLRVIGVLVIVAGLFTPFFGVERSKAILNWWSSQGPLSIRTLGGVAIIFGLFLVYVVNSPRRIAA